MKHPSERLNLLFPSLKLTSVQCSPSKIVASDEVSLFFTDVFFVQRRDLLVSGRVFLFVKKKATHMGI